MSRLRIISKGYNVKRYHTLPTIRTDTVGHHSGRVAALLAAYHPSPTARLLMAALAHDVPEAVTGDIPSPAKKALGIDAAVAIDRAEGEVIEKAGLVNPQSLDFVDQWWLKLADNCDGLLFCAEEAAMGNRFISEAAENYTQYILGMMHHPQRPQEAGVLVDDTFKEWNHATK